MQKWGRSMFTIDDRLLKNDERAVYKLRKLFSDYGYIHYKVNKFEGYDFYAKNKDFLKSENILTFPDTNGNLKALKPDVTLSIVKNAALDGGVLKLFYNESVYRPSHETGSFREIMQTGLECIGDIGQYEMGEVLMLAAKSLLCISESYLLDISHMGLVSEIFELAGVKNCDVLLKLLGEKNVHELEKVCRTDGVSEDWIEKISSLCRIYGRPSEVLPKLLSDFGDTNGYKELSDISAIMEKYGLEEKIRIDFSLGNDMNYYNGLIFQGFIDGITSVFLSGGRYAKLVEKLKRKGGAVGFALSLDLLERYGGESREKDVDVLLLVDDDVAAEEILLAAEKIRESGSSVRVERSSLSGVKYGECKRLTKNGICEVDK